MRLSVRARRLKRKYLKVRYGNMFREVSAILFQHDPIGIAIDNEFTDEYDVETGTILPRLSRCHSQIEVQQIVFEEFRRWFTPEVAGGEERYTTIAEDLWRLWSKNQN